MEYMLKMSEAFDALTKDMENWKMPIHTKINVSDWDLMCDACEFYTGSSLWQVACLDDGMIEVKADGYYMAVGP